MQLENRLACNIYNLNTPLIGAGAMKKKKI